MLEVWESNNDPVPWQDGRAVYRVGGGVEVVIESFRLNQAYRFPFKMEFSQCLEFVYSLSAEGEINFRKDGSYQSQQLFPRKRSISWGMQGDGIFEIASGKPVQVVHVHVPPANLIPYFGNCSEQHIDQFVKMATPGKSVYGRVDKMEGEIASIIHQMIHNNLRGHLRDLYIRSKTVELLILEVNQQLHQKRNCPAFNPQDVQLLHQARQIILERFQEPPTLATLAREVGISEKKLKCGYRCLFNDTVFGTLKTHRMEQARLLFDSGEANVSEAATAVGYSNFSHFSRAFMQQFGILPREYLQSRKVG